MSDLRRVVRTVIGALGLTCFAIGGAFAVLILASELYAKITEGVFGNGLNEAGFPLLMGIFGGLTYLVASIDARLEQRT